MKNVILTTTLFLGMTFVSSSQTTISDMYNCVNEKYSTLTQCLTSNDATGMYIGSGSILYFQPDVGVTYNQVFPCVDSYNKDRVDCETAPLLIIGNGVKKKKTVL